MTLVIIDLRYSRVLRLQVVTLNGRGAYAERHPRARMQEHESWPVPQYLRATWRPGLHVAQTTVACYHLYPPCPLHDIHLLEPLMITDEHDDKGSMA